MKTRVQKWGNSLALRIPKSYAAEARLEPGASVELTLVDGSLIVHDTFGDVGSLIIGDTLGTLGSILYYDTFTSVGSLLGLDTFRTGGSLRQNDTFI